ncbi:phage tail protein [Tetragenococcus koreensis]|uniref:prophage endopeptidase tail family protein n=1 Tax=Tetragenococcus koreensis TaxID=290335 RepID=UPI001F22488F|nr:prophage endopeptidase tail family protein [Tetragenococcus koreensis]MCF1614777.1 phage tail protein [Tetragenococcus koreensis]MCF1624657.1 phage tail protein [Tetragenococcus koreensis]
MDALVLKNKKETFSEILTDFDFGSFKYEYEKNNERSISFTIFKTTQNADIFENLLNEMLLQWQGQDYVVKSTSIKYDGLIVSNEVEAKHIFMEFQGHNIKKEEKKNDEEDKKRTMKLKEYLDYGFKDNKLGFSYQIKGKFDKSAAVDELGGKNGMEHLTEGADLFGYVYFADNKKITIYDEESFYEMSELPLIYKYNSSDVTATTTTTDLRTYIEGYGKKKEDTEKDEYELHETYKSPNYNIYGHLEAPTVYEDNAKNKNELLDKMKEELNDEPTVEVSTNHLGEPEHKRYMRNDDIKENHMIHFIHQPLNYNLDLKVVKITKGFPLLHEPVEVDFSNSPKDILKIQRDLNRNVKRLNNMTTGSMTFQLPENYSESVGVTIVDE